MKQGPSTSKAGDQKREPISHAVSPCAAGDIGLQYVGKSEPLYEGRGIEAPLAGTDYHPKGSQGKH